MKHIALGVLFAFALHSGLAGAVVADPPALPGTNWIGLHKEKASAKKLGSFKDERPILVSFLSATEFRIVDDEDNTYDGTYVQDGSLITVTLDPASIALLESELSAIASNLTGLNVVVSVVSIEVTGKVSGKAPNAKVSYKISAPLLVEVPGLGTVTGKYQAKGKTLQLL